MDRIIVKKNADMQRVLDWAEELRGMAVELPFSEGEIEFVEELIRLNFRDMGDGVVYFEMYMHTESRDWFKVVEWRTDLRSNDIIELHIAGDGETKMKMSMILMMDDTVGKCVRKFRALMLFSAYYREEVKRTRTVSRVSAGGSSRSKRSGQRKLTIRRYEIGGEMLSELPAPKKEWYGYRESFGVRGHYRRYKSGKVVWVRPYTKKGVADKCGDREYVL